MKKICTLEDITFPQYVSYPQFTMINYMFQELESFYMKKHQEVRKALLLAQLPPLFEKYNIPFVKGDLDLWIHANHNIANRDEIISFLSQESKTIEKQLSYSKELYNYYTKLMTINDLSTIHGEIKTEIVERYGYYFDEEEEECFENFRVFLGNRINEEGKIPYRQPLKRPIEKQKSLKLSNNKKR